MTNKQHCSLIVDGVMVLRAATDLVRRYGSADLIDKFCEPIESFMREGGDLAAHLGVKGIPGNKFTPGQMYFLSQRDSYLRAAFACCEVADKSSRINKLFEEIEEFRSHRWESTKDKKQPPARWSNLNKNLWHVFAVAPRCPLQRVPSDKRIRTICKIESPPASSRACEQDALGLLSDHERKRSKSVA